jgi:hypothetical protein
MNVFHFGNLVWFSPHKDVSPNHTPLHADANLRRGGTTVSRSQTRVLRMRCNVVQPCRGVYRKAHASRLGNGMRPVGLTFPTSCFVLRTASLSLGCFTAEVEPQKVMQVVHKLNERERSEVQDARPLFPCSGLRRDGGFAKKLLFQV